ncbi:hypothetical protein ABB02_00323 [Clostridiaceae bacterium JG1575]|nr:hypothetical protein ABB02_00323 [Clostridiaceae bacterium JG1575]
MDLHLLLAKLIPLLITLLELTGVLLIAFGSVKAIVDLIRSRFNLGNEDTKLTLAQSLALALEFKMGAEILKTITVRTLDELKILGAIVLIRVVLTFVIHWEIKTTHEDKKKMIHQIRIQQEREKLAAIRSAHAESGSDQEPS